MVMAAIAKVWTLGELHSLPDDGNKYELIRGELLVTPAPRPSHELVLTRLMNILFPYVFAHDLGWIFRPRAVIRESDSEVEPDLMVRQPPAHDDASWEDQPLPLLVVECTSRSTRRRDHSMKRDFYRGLGIAEYWVVDRETLSIHVYTPGGKGDRVEKREMIWRPSAAPDPLHFAVPGLFGPSSF
jgi:Uma2 family endonuclease